ncbi:methylated-DNA--[protein]-cysteine S-methyltransferase [Pelistega sp. NLN82]|uniref:methylated-DNA--[protein]-cysteine S-methyltransferase n=1 Tax=Pelistega ratti TaxID=2652177 RepID=A0A6L9Y3N4_9BURK|nr:methylated-DNA--[protein]-cysteine S-methyltransferase [Pelistega ratti]NEN75029.1 methylated-DNA--[protein]-cysteine S-methyltransferase [Pelistega ratti]
MSLYGSYISTPLGEMLAVSHDKGICLLNFTDNPLLNREIQIIEQYLKTSIQYCNHSHLLHLQQELQDYFNGQLQQFTTPLLFVGTPFQQQVWQALLQVPYGQTTYYQALAESLQNPKAIRAVAMGNARNHILILIPCHRVIGKNGHLVGYSAGIGKKEALLTLEKYHHSF